MEKLTFRRLSFMGFLLCIAVWVIALVLQFVSKIAPCPLCIFQRILFAAIGILLLLACIHNPKKWGKYIYSSLSFIFSLGGLAVAGRQVWLQHLPPGQAPLCGPGLNYLIKELPIFSAIKKVLEGSGECAAVHWHFLSLTIPEWSGIIFIFLALLSIFLFFTKAVYS